MRELRSWTTPCMTNASILAHRRKHCLQQSSGWLPSRGEVPPRTAGNVQNGRPDRQAQSPIQSAYVRRVRVSSSQGKRRRRMPDCGTLQPHPLATRSGAVRLPGGTRRYGICATAEPWFRTRPDENALYLSGAYGAESLRYQICPCSWQVLHTSRQSSGQAVSGGMHP